DLPSDAGQLLLHLQAGHLGHLQVKKDTTGPILRRVSKKLSSRPEGLGVDPDGVKKPHQRIAEARIIVHNEHLGVSRYHAASLGATVASPASGNTNRNTEPTSAAGSIRMRPPCDSAMERLIERPMLSPVGLVV